MSYVDVQGLSNLQEGVSTLRGLMEDGPLAEWLQFFAEPYLKSRIAGRFASEGDDASGKWAALHAATQGFRARDGYPPDHPINVRTGRLRDFAINTHTIQATPGGVTLTKPALGADWLTELKLTHAQRGGTTRRGNAFPARPVAVVSTTDSMALRFNLMGWFEQGFRAGAA